MILLRSILFNLFFFSWTIAISIVCLPSLLLPPKIIASTVARTWAKVSLRAAEFICGIKYEIRGQEFLPDTPCIIASKHQSAWETMIFYCLTEYPAFILKKELAHIPIYGRYLKAVDSIIIDRDAGASALKNMVNDTKDRLNKGRVVIIFPEGTRVKVGEKGIYHPGVSALYSRCEVPVIPVALNSGKFWAKNSFIKRPGKIILEFLPPINPGMRRDQFMEKLEQSIENKSNELLNL